MSRLSHHLPFQTRIHYYSGHPTSIRSHPTREDAQYYAQTASRDIQGATGVVYKLTNKDQLLSKLCKYRQGKEVSL